MSEDGNQTTVAKEGKANWIIQSYVRLRNVTVMLVIATQTTSLYEAGIFSNLHFAGESQSMAMPMLAGVVLGENTTLENVNKLKKLVKITLLR